LSSAVAAPVADVPVSKIGKSTCAARCLFERHHGAVALTAAFDRKEASDRHHDRQIGVSGAGNSAGNPSQAQSDHERRKSVAQCP